MLNLFNIFFFIKVINAFSPCAIPSLAIPSLCDVCNSSYFSDQYRKTLHLFDKALECQLRIGVLERKVYVDSTIDCSKSSNCLSFNQIYIGLEEAFIKETQIFEDKLMGKLEIFINAQENHMLGINNERYEVFRRQNINIFIGSFQKDKFANITINNGFYFFISNNITMSNLIFFFKLNSQSYSQINYKYGFFNMEFLFDNKMYLAPLLLLQNCMFFGLEKVNPIDFSSLITIGKYSAIILIRNSKLENLIFNKGLFYVYNTGALLKPIIIYQYDLNQYAILIFKSYLSTIIYILQSIFYSFNCLNPLDLLNFAGFPGMIDLEKLLFYDIKIENGNLINFENINNYIYLFNTTMKGIYQCQLLNFASNQYVRISNLTLSDYNNNYTHAIIAILCPKIILDRLFFNSIYLTYLEIGILHIQKSTLQIFQSKFEKINAWMLIQSSESNAEIYQSIFSEIEIQRFLIFNSLSSEISIYVSSFDTIKSKDVIFYGLNSNSFNMSSNSIINIQSKFIFRFDNVDLILIHKSEFNSMDIRRFFNGDMLTSKLFLMNNYILKSILTSFISFTSDSERYIAIIETLFSDLSVEGDLSMIKYAAPGDYLIRNSLFIRVKKVDKKTGSFLFSIENKANFVVDNSHFINCGSNLTIRDFQNWDSNLDIDGLLLFWNILNKITINQCIFLVNDSKTGLPNGFIVGETYVKNISIIGSTFILQNLNTDYYYKGIIMYLAQYLLIRNCTFSGLSCNMMSKIHYTSTILIFTSFGNNISSDFEIFLADNEFYDCVCQKYGTITIQNYGEIKIINNIFEGSISFSGPSTMNIINGNNLTISNNIFTKSISYKSSILIENIDLFTCNHNIISKIDNMFGSYIEIIDVKKTLITRLHAENSYGSFIKAKDSNLNMEQCELQEISNYCDFSMIYFNGNNNITLTNIRINSSIGSNSFISILNAIFVSFNDLSIENSKSDNINENAAAFDINFVEKICFFNNIYVENIKGVSLFRVNLDNLDLIILLTNINCLNLKSHGVSFLYFLSNARLYLSHIYIDSVSEILFSINWYYKVYVQLFHITVFFSNCSYVLTQEYVDITIMYLQLIETTCIKNCFQIKHSNFYLLFGIFFINSLKTSSSFIEADSSYLLFYNLNYNREIGTLYDNFEFNVWNSICLLSDIIQENLANVRNPSYSLQNSILSVYNSTFKKNKGIIFNLTNTNTTINKVFFYTNGLNTKNELRASEIESQGGLGNFNLIFIDCNTIIFNSQAFKILRIQSIIIIRSIFKTPNLKTSLINSKAFYIEDCESLDVKQGFFQGLYSSYLAAALHCYSSLDKANVNINNSIFEKMVANFSSCILLAGVFQSLLNNSVFLQNNALRGEAAVMIINCRDPTCETSLSNNIFYYNFALTYAPNILTLSKVNDISNNHFINNRNLLNLSNKFASGPLKLQFLKLQYHEKEFNIKSPYLEIISGTPFNLSFLVQDYNSETLIFINTLQGILKPDILSASGKQEKKELKIANGIGWAVNGILNFYNVRITHNPNNTLNFLVSAIYTDLPYNLPNYLFSTPISFKVRPCIEGEIILFNECIECPIRKFSLSDPMEEKTIQKFRVCNEKESFCLGTNLLFPKYGYWRPNNSDVILRCPLERACEGLNTSYLDNKTELKMNLYNSFCKEGHTDTICYACEKEWGKFDFSGICEKCENLMVWSIIRLVAIIFFFFMYLLYLTHNFSKIALEKIDKDYSFVSLTLKICMSHLQMLALLYQFKEKTPFNSAALFIQMPEYLTMFSYSIISHDCLFQRMMNFPLYKSKLITSITLPIIFSLFLILFWIIIFFLQCSTPSPLLKLRRRAMISILITIHTFYLFTVQSSFSLFNCFDIPVSSTEFKYVLRQNPNIECWTPSHTDLIMSLAFPGLLVWGLLYPLLVFGFLKKYHGSKRIINYRKALLSLSTVKHINKNFSSINRFNNKYQTMGNMPKINLIPCDFYMAESKLINVNNDSPGSTLRPLRLISEENLHTKKTLNVKEQEIQEIESVLKSSNKNNNQANIKNLKVFPKNSEEKEHQLNRLRRKIQTNRLFTFFYQAYQPEYYYWEIFVFIRQIIVISCVTILGNYEIKYTIVLLFLVLLLWGIMNNKPYRNNLLNNIEIGCLIVQIITFFCIFIVNTQDISENGVLTFYFLIIIPNFAVLSSFVIVLIRRVLQQIKDKAKFKIEEIAETKIIVFTD